jgi:hypothetical protein
MSITVRGLISQEERRLVRHALACRSGDKLKFVRHFGACHRGSAEEKPLATAHERLSGELLGLTCVLAVTFGKKVSQ